MKPLFMSIMTFIVIFHAFLSSSSYAIPMQPIEANDDDILDQTWQIEDVVSQPRSKKDELRADLAKGSYDSVLNKIAETFKKEILKPGILSIKIAALIGKKDFAAARKEMSHFNKHKSIPEEAVLLIGTMYLKASKPLDALKVCQKGLAANMKSPKLIFMMGRIYDSIGQSNTSLIYYKRAAELNEKTTSIPERALNESIANSYLKLHQFTKAKDVFTNQEDIQPKSLIQEIAFAKYYASRGEFSKALDLLDEIAATKREHASTLIKAQILNLAGKPEKAIDLLTDLKQQAPQSYPMVSVELIKSLSYLLTNSPQKSLAALNQINFSGKRPPNIELVLAIIQLTLGDAQSATQALKRAPMPFPEISTHKSMQNHLKPPSLGPTIGLAYFCMDQGYYDQAIKIANGAIAKNPNNIFLHFLLAETYRRTNKYDMALTEFKHLNTIMPESFSFRFLLAKTYEEAGMHQEALKNYAALSKERPDFLLTQLAYGKLLRRLGQWDKARNAYEWSLNFKPDSVPLHISLGWTLAHLKDLKALAPVLRSLKANKKTKPDSILHLEGWAAYQRKDLAKAVELLAQALEAAPGNPEVCYHLGMAYIATGDHQKAENLLEQAFLFPEQREKYKKQAD